MGHLDLRDGYLMVGTIKIIWVRGTLKDNGREVAGPGDTVLVDHLRAEEYVRSGQARYPGK